MAKLNKKILKEMIKECLIEVLSEGLGTSTIQQTPSKDSSIPKLNLESNISHNKKYNENFAKKTGSLIKNTTSDPVLQGIFEDTARTTLQEQIQADGNKAGYIKPRDEISNIVDQSDPTSLFGEASANWASLAFSDSVKQK